MAKLDGTSKIQEVLDAKVRLLEARYAVEMRIKKELRAKQVAIADQEKELAETLQASSIKQPTSFRFGELRLHKLVQDQRRLQPVLAKAAIQRDRVQDQLKAALRQRLALDLIAAQRTEEVSQPHVTTQEALLIFEMMKRL